jgi:hypothetical protein
VEEEVEVGFGRAVSELGDAGDEAVVVDEAGKE